MLLTTFSDTYKMFSKLTKTFYNRNTASTLTGYNVINKWLKFQ